MADAAAIKAWLTDMHLERYVDSFLDNGYDDWEVITALENEDLDAMGISLPGHRKKIMLAVHKLNSDTDEDLSLGDAQQEDIEEDELTFPLGIKNLKQLDKLNKFFGENLEEDEANFDVYVCTEEDLSDIPSRRSADSNQDEVEPSEESEGHKTPLKTRMKLTQKQLEKLAGFFGEGIDTVTGEGESKVILTERQLDKLSRIFGESVKSVLFQENPFLGSAKRVKKKGKR